MSERKCKRCESIEYGIWGTIGLLGYSMIIAAVGYTISYSFYVLSFPIVLVVFGTILWLPMVFISHHERKELEENATVKK